MLVELKLLVEYDTSAYDDEADALSECQTVLHASIYRVISNGGLSGDTSLTVESFEYHTDLLEG